MTAIMEDRVVTEDVSEDDDPEVLHLVCHCTNVSVAACSLYVGDDSFADEDTTLMDCPLCRLMWPPGSETCPWGCDCTDADFCCGQWDGVEHPRTT